jgi:hypothetical protein
MDKFVDRQDAIRRLREAGILNPERFVTLIKNTIDLLHLDLSGLTVLTEAASGPYVCTPVIAALAGAEHVLAVTRDSRYASADTVISLTRALEQLCGIPDKLEIFTKRGPGLFARANIVTNLGFVRPIDAKAVAAMKPTAVVPLMCEAWEFRPDDVDLDACRRKGIQVLGTNEDLEGLEVFGYSGVVCLRLLLDAQIELHKSRIVVVSTDKFGNTITECLRRVTTRIELSPSIPSAQVLSDVDALILADYTRSDEIIGSEGDITAAQLAQAAPGITVVQFCGRIDVQGLQNKNITVFPPKPLRAHRMALTLGGIGPRPVIELHTAGLKVGEISLRQHQSPSHFCQYSHETLVQPLTDRAANDSTGPR